MSLAIPSRSSLSVRKHLKQRCDQNQFAEQGNKSSKKSSILTPSFLPVQKGAASE
jgi:hypothetical protein